MMDHQIVLYKGIIRDVGLDVGTCSILRKFQQTPGTYPQPPVHEGNPFVFVFWSAWGMFQFS